jgi:hypothetical protein
MRLLISFLGAILSSTARAEPAPEPSNIAAARALFENDWVLMNWALQHFDFNHDAILEPNEARAAAEAFRRLADTNHDGRITPQKYEAARVKILNDGD